MGVESGGMGDTSPNQNIRRDVPSKNTHENIKKVTIFNGSKLDLKFHHNLSIVVAILDRTKLRHVLVSPIKNTCPSTDPTRKRPLKCVPPTQKCVATPLPGQVNDPKVGKIGTLEHRKVRLL